MKKIIFAFFAAAGLVSCLETADQTILVSSVVVTPESRLMRVGGTDQLTAIVYPTNATGKDVVWTSTDPSKVSVDQTGKITALALTSGQVTVAATTANGKTDNCLVTVEPTPPTGLSLSYQLPTAFRVGDTFVITAAVAPSDATDKTVKWSLGIGGDEFVSLSPSADNTSVSVRALKYSASNSVTIVATSNSRNASGLYQTAELSGLKVAATPVSGVSVVEVGTVPANPKNGDTFVLKATIEPETATNRTVTWTSSNTAVASIDDAGKVTIKDVVGTVTFTATVVGESPAKSGDSKPYTTVRVPATNVLIRNQSNVNVTDTEQPLALNATHIFSATMAPTTTTDKVLSWASSAPDVASVNPAGTVAALTDGTAIITVTVGTQGSSGTVSASFTIVSGTGIAPEPTPDPTPEP